MEKINQTLKTIKNHHKINIELLTDSILGIIRISEYPVSRIGHPELPCAVPHTAEIHYQPPL
ncbi:MAG: hypothetical protein A2097_00910 [Desulfobacula sp. GWF2_41_7]|nr:MAG: hypothetical protein A2097_00910 [Desulfobacula sp. GWF2_41_7]